MDPEVAGSTPANRTILLESEMSKMPRGIHLFVQHADYYDPVLANFIENRVALKLEAGISAPESNSMSPC